MAHLNMQPNIQEPDDFYAELIATHDGLNKTESDAFNARLILLLANHIGDRQTLTEALRAAKLNYGEGIRSSGSVSSPIAC